MKWNKEKIVFNLRNLQLQDIMEFENLDKFKKWFELFLQVVKDW